MERSVCVNECSEQGFVTPRSLNARVHVQPDQRRSQ
jgi:hypothetical protein